MKILENFRANRYLILALFFALLNAGGIFLIFGFQEYGDTEGYINTIHGFLGQGEFEVFPWILRPLGPLLAAPFEFLGEGAGLIVQNVIFYLLSAYLIFRITELIYHKKRQAFFASLFFITATPVIEVGLSYLTDSGAWFFYLLSLFLTLLYLKNGNEKLIPLNGFLCSLGFLMKENGGLGVLFFGIIILLSKKFSLKEKFFKIILFGIFFLIPLLIFQFFIYQHFHFTSLDWYHRGNGEGALLATFRYLGQLFRVLGILWPFFLIGVWREWKEKNWEKLKIFFALLPASFSFLLWSTSAGGRATFIFAPLGIILASYGLEFFQPKMKKATLIAFFMVLIIFNYYFCWINPQFPFVDRIAEFLGIL